MKRNSHRVLCPQDVAGSRIAPGSFMASTLADAGESSACNADRSAA